MTMTQPGVTTNKRDTRSQKSESVNELIQSLAEILDDLDTPHASLVLGRMRKLARSLRRTGRSEAAVALSQRECQVLVLIGHGYTRRDIADSLGISTHTAARHIANIYGKLGISSVAEATTYALQHNLIAMADRQ